MFLLVLYVLPCLALRIRRQNAAQLVQIQFQRYYSPKPVIRNVYLGVTFYLRLNNLRWSLTWSDLKYYWSSCSKKAIPAHIAKITFSSFSGSSLVLTFQSCQRDKASFCLESKQYHWILRANNRICKYKKAIDKLVDKSNNIKWKNGN